MKSFLIYLFQTVKSRNKLPSSSSLSIGIKLFRKKLTQTKNAVCRAEGAIKKGIISSPTSHKRTLNKLFLLKQMSYVLCPSALINLSQQVKRQLNAFDDHSCTNNGNNQTHYFTNYGNHIISHQFHNILA